MAHLDTTSFHVDGRYNSDHFDENAEGVIHVSKGYSRDHREDLNQVVLELITESRANLPMMMRPLSGNASDKTSVSRMRSSATSASFGVMTVGRPWSSSPTAPASPANAWRPANAGGLDGS
jgi:transposase